MSRLCYRLRWIRVTSMQDHARVADELSTRQEYKETRKLRGKHHDHSIQSYRYRNGLEPLAAVVSGTSSRSNERVPSRPHFGETIGLKHQYSARAVWHSRPAELLGNWKYSGRSTARGNDRPTGDCSIPE